MYIKVFWVYFLMFVWLGTTAQQLIDGVHNLTRGIIQGRFFHFYPARRVELLKWLGSWIKKGNHYYMYFVIYLRLLEKYNCNTVISTECGLFLFTGAVPIATLNLQKGVKPGWTIPDAWHHQMIYGVSSKGIKMNNVSDHT